MPFIYKHACNFHYVLLGALISAVWTTVIVAFQIGLEALLSRI